MARQPMQLFFFYQVMAEQMLTPFTCSRRSPRSCGPNRQICWQEFTKTGQGGGRSGRKYPTSLL
ncbi:hypothetical protein M6B38_284010 [Iris pallida]|uniref:Uncharacterized protein n=1 Tax=Iris pallida TaxID=29817 RepID=A0AAX6I381_IRIPA|nr:hypothetical protein M6B38_284010 [Iris pallida]